MPYPCVEQNRLTENMKAQLKAPVTTTEQRRQSARLHCMNATEASMSKVNKWEQAVKKNTSSNTTSPRLRRHKPVAEAALSTDSPNLKQPPTQTLPLMSRGIGIDIDKEHEINATSDVVPTEKEKAVARTEDGPKWAPMTKQHASGLRKVEELSSIRPEHPGAKVNNCPEKAYISLETRRLKREWLLKIDWDGCRSPVRAAKKSRMADESSPRKEPQDSKAKMKLYQKEAFLFKSSFEGKIVMDEIAPSFGYTFVVPGFVTFSMLATFKCKESVDLHRRRMNKIATAKSVFYYQLHWREGYKNTSAMKQTWRDNTLIDNTMYYTLEGYLKSIGEAINGATGHNAEYETLCSLIETEKAVHQPGHIDDRTCDGVAGEFQPWILHQPLCAEGRSLQIWVKGENDKLSPQLLHIPFGSACLLRGDIYHGGCYGSMGNIGFHAQLNPRPAEGKFLGLLPESRNERLRETDIPANEVNSTARTQDQAKFTQKYLRNMKRMYPSESFWLQHPEENANWEVTRMSLKSS